MRRTAWVLGVLAVVGLLGPRLKFGPYDLLAIGDLLGPEVKVGAYDYDRVAAATASTTQAPSQIPGAFRSSITLVPIDVRVLDREGQPVTDLKQTDFTILENGVTQEIAHFSHVVLAPQPPPPAAEGPTLRRAPSFDIAPQKQRIFLIVLGRGRLRYPSKATEALLQFVRERLLPQDQVAVLAWNRATDFTTEHEKVAQVLERFEKANEDIEGSLAFHFSSLAAAYGSKEIPRDIQVKIDGVFGRETTDAGKSAEVKSGSGIGGRAADAGKRPIPSRQLPPSAISESPRIDRDARRVVDDLLSSGNSYETDLPFEEFVQENSRTLQDLGNVYTGIEYLRFLEGEKHLILVTEKGLFLPRVEDDQRIAEAANSARVVIDTVETGGLYIGLSAGAIQGGPNPGQWTQFWAFSSLRTIAELTGGRSSIAEWSRVAFDRIDTSTRAGYLLGYYPKNMKWDGRYRKVKVTVNRPGVTLLYRHGYEASDQLVPFDRQAFLTFNRIISAALYPSELRDIRLKASASLKTAEAGPGRDLTVDVKIDAARVSFTTENELHLALLDVALFVLDRDGRVVDERWQKIDLNLKDDAYEQCRRDGIPYNIRFPAKPRVYEVKVIVYDYGADVLGTAQVRVF